MGWLYSRSISIDHTKCGTADSLNFPVLFAGTFNGSGGILDLRTVANGGKVQSSSGYDIAFFSDAGLTILLNFERVQWNSSTGASEFFINIATLSHSANTVFYIAYGNSSINSDQQNQNNTWNSNFSGVFHYYESSGTTVHDSTSNANNATATRTQILGGASGPYSPGLCGTFVRSSSDRCTLSDITPYHFTSAFSLMYWYKDSSFSGEYLTGISVYGSDGTNGYGTLLMHVNQDSGNVNTSRNAIGTNTASDILSYGNTAHTDTTNWHRVVTTWDGSNVNFYQDNASEGSTANTTAPSYAKSIAPVLGALNFNGSFFHHQDGFLDEQYILKNFAASPSWITADYNNQNSPSTFYTIGSEISGTTPNGYVQGNAPQPYSRQDIMMF